VFIINRSIVVLLRKILRKLIRPGTYFSYSNSSQFKKSLSNEIDFTQINPCENGSLHIISEPNQINQMVESGYIFNSPTDLQKIKTQFNNSFLLFVYFINKKLAHISWVSLSDNPNTFHWYLKKIDFSEEGYIGPCYTYPDQRGKGIYPYVLLCICEELRKRGFNRALIDTKKSHTASIKGIEKAGFDESKSIRFCKILFLKIWNEKVA